MTGSLRAFLTGLIDYARMLPPANLDLQTAVRNFARHSAETDAWMLSRFVLAAEELPETAPLHDEIFEPAEIPLRFAILIGGGESSDQSLAKITEQASLMRDFHRRHGVAAVIEALETRLPEEIAGTTETKTIRDYLDSLTITIRDVCIDRPELYVEHPSLDHGNRNLATVLSGLSEFALSQGIGDDPTLAKALGPFQRVGLKLRCGADAPGVVPDVSLLAETIHQCSRRAIPLKCAAGLQNPLRVSGGPNGSARHGFLNVFGAGILAQTRRLVTDEIQSCLQDESVTGFRFEEDGFAWRDTKVTTAEIVEARYRLMTCFGSSSFDEPREQLQRLGLLSE